MNLYQAFMAWLASWCLRAPADPLAEYFSTPKQVPTTQTPPFRICSAHQRLMELHVATPHLTQTLFGVLGLDPDMAPFSPAEDCAIGRPNHNAALEELLLAARRQTKGPFSELNSGGHDYGRVPSQSSQERLALAVLAAAEALRDDSTRAFYLFNVLPWEKRLKNTARVEKLKEACVRHGLWLLGSEGDHRAEHDEI